MDIVLAVNLFIYLMLFVLLRIAYEKLWDQDAEKK